MAEFYGEQRIYETGRNVDRNILNGWEERLDLFPLESQSKTTDELLLLRSNSGTLIADIHHIIDTVLTKNSPHREPGIEECE